MGLAPFPKVRVAQASQCWIVGHGGSSHNELGASPHSWPSLHRANPGWTPAHTGFMSAPSPCHHPLRRGPQKRAKRCERGTWWSGLWMC